MIFKIFPCFALLLAFSFPATLAGMTHVTYYLTPPEIKTSIQESAAPPGYIPSSSPSASQPSIASDNPSQEKKERPDFLQETISGRLLADYRNQNKNGLIAVQTRDGQITAIQEEDLISVAEDEEEFIPMTQKEIAESLLKSMGPHYHTEITDHFVLIYNTSVNYAVWCGRLFESLYSGFNIYQNRRKFDLPAPEFPMVVILLPNRKAFQEYALEEMPDASGIAAYYNRLTNRVVLYDLSEEEQERTQKNLKKRTYQEIETFLRRPQASFSVRTIVHEATHQIAFNRNLFLRTGPYPLWAAEGLSMFFESPDPDAPNGWRYHGAKGTPNLIRLGDLQKYFQNLSSNPIQEIVQEEHFNDDLLYSYALSWGLYYYLQSKEPQKLTEYLKLTAQKSPYARYSPQERLADFEKVFGSSENRHLTAFLKFILSLP